MKSFCAHEPDAEEAEGHATGRHGGLRQGGAEFSRLGGSAQNEEVFTEINALINDAEAAGVWRAWISCVTCWIRRRWETGRCSGTAASTWNSRAG